MTGRSRLWSSSNPEAAAARSSSTSATAALLDDPGWVAVRALPSDIGSLTARSGRLTITADGNDLDTMRPQFLGRRQQHLTASVATRIDASAGVGGLAARLSEDHYFAIEADGTRGATAVAARARLSGIEHTWSGELPAGEILFRIEMRHRERLQPRRHRAATGSG